MLYGSSANISAVQSATAGIRGIVVGYRRPPPAAISQVTRNVIIALALCSRHTPIGGAEHADSLQHAAGCFTWRCTCRYFYEFASMWRMYLGTCWCFCELEPAVTSLVIMSIRLKAYGRITVGKGITWHILEGTCRTSDWWVAASACRQHDCYLPTSCNPPDTHLDSQL